MELENAYRYFRPVDLFRLGQRTRYLWRGLVKAMVKRGHTVSFYEKDVPYYAATRDNWLCPYGAGIHLYDFFEAIQKKAALELNHADLALSTSYCPDGPAASELILNSNAAIKAFYDLDTPVTLGSLRSGETVPYLPAGGLGGFDLVLSYTGGRALEELQTRLGAKKVAPLYGSVDPETHCPVTCQKEFSGALCYLGTYAEDRQKSLEELFLKPADLMGEEKFILGGAQYPANFLWRRNIFFLRHLPPSLHATLFCSTRATLNITRGAMTEYGDCPSGRLFEAAACGVAMLSDWWEGLETFLLQQRKFFTSQRQQMCVMRCHLQIRN